MDLKNLNAVSLLEKQNKPIRKLAELQLNKKYKIVYDALINTEFRKAGSIGVGVILLYYCLIIRNILEIVPRYYFYF